MACMISLSLKDSAIELEKPSHPSHNVWFKSLALFREMGLENAHDTTARRSSNHSYYCVDLDHPQKAIYLYSQCSDKKFKNMEAKCFSKTSKLNQVLSPLLAVPFSAQSVSRLDTELNLIYPAFVAGHATKCLEFLTFFEIQRPMLLSSFLDPYRAAGSRANLAEVPVKSYSTAGLTGETNTHFSCIEWKSFEDHIALFSDNSLRKQMRSVNADLRAPYVQALGKKEGELTWEEDLDIFFNSTGTKKIEHRLMIAKFVNDEYLGIEAKKSKGSCRIL